VTSTNAADRAALIKGLRALASFLEAHPDVPVPPAYHEITVHYFPPDGTDDEQRAAVDAVASALGTTAGDPEDCGYYETERVFGPVVYKALAISHQRRALHAAWASYSGAVSVDDDQAVAA
jgi:hypothetical protein